MQVMEAVLYVTRKCNLSCEHCIVDKEDNSDLPTDKVETLANDYPINRTILSGGEPFLHDNFEELVALVPEPTVLSNGLVLSDEEYVEENSDMLEELNGIQLSVEGKEETTDARRGEGVWDRVMEAHQNLSEIGVESYLRSTYSREMMEEVGELMEFCDAEGISLVLFPEIGEPPLSPTENASFFDYAVEKGVVVATPDFHSYIGEGGECPAAKTRISVDVNGEIYPCQFNWDYCLGEVGDEWGLIESRMERFDRTEPVPRTCSRCDFANKCRGCGVADTWSGCPIAKGLSHSESPSRRPLKRVQETMNTLEDVGAPRGCHGC